MTNEEIARQLEIYLEKLNDYLKDCNEQLLLTAEAQKIIRETVEEVKKKFFLKTRDNIEYLTVRQAGFLNGGYGTSYTMLLNQIAKNSNN